MADTAVDESQIEETEGEDGEAEATTKGKGKRKLLSGKRLVIGVGVFVLVLGGAWYKGILDAFLGGAEEDAAHEEVVHQKDMTYFDLPDLLVNLTTTANKPSYLRLVVSLDLEDAAVISELKRLMPRIIDNFQVYLRELRAEDLSGSAGVYRLKEELLARVNTAVQPVEVNDVLFKELLVQ